MVHSGTRSSTHSATSYLVGKNPVNPHSIDFGGELEDCLRVKSRLTKKAPCAVFIVNGVT